MCAGYFDFILVSSELLTSRCYVSEICENLSMLSCRCCIKHVRMRSQRYEIRSMFALCFATGMHSPCISTRIFFLPSSLATMMDVVSCIPCYHIHGSHIRVSTFYFVSVNFSIFSFFGWICCRFFPDQVPLHNSNYDSCDFFSFYFIQNAFE